MVVQFTFTLTFLATILVSSYASVTNIKVETVQDRQCDFGLWKVTPVHSNTCTRQYVDSWLNIWLTSTSPFCYHSDGTWNRCKSYSWDVEFPEDRHLIKSQSRRKSYSYDRSHTEKTYDEAARICHEKGEGWDVANFQAVPDYHYYYKTVSATNGGYREAEVRQFRTTSQEYQKAVENIQLAIGPLDQTWETFWVKNEKLGWNCMNFDRYASSGRTTSVTGFSDHKGKEATLLSTHKCHYRSAVICEKDLE